MSEFNKNISAKLSNLMYSKALNINEPRTNGDSHTVYDQFYDNNGQIRPEVDSETKAYLESNQSVVVELQNYDVVAISGDNLDGYAGMVISPKTDDKQALQISRGTEFSISDPIDSATDIYSDLSQGTSELAGGEWTTSQVDSAHRLMSKAKKEQPSIETIGQTGHSLGGAIAQIMEKYVIKDGLNLGESYTYNAPPVKDIATAGMTDAQKAEMVAKTQRYSVNGDPISEDVPGEFLADPIKIDTVANTGMGKHSIEPLAIDGQSTLDPESNPYLNSNGSLNEISLANRLSDLSAQTAVLEQSISQGDYGFWDQLENYLGIADADNPYTKLDAIKTEQQGIQNMLGNKAGYEDVASNYENIKFINDFMVESVGGEPGESLLQAIVNSALEQPAQESQQQFINSLKESGLVESLLSSEGNVTDTLSQLADSLADINRNAQRAQVFRGDPLTFDLDNDGIETLSVDEGVLFDHEAKDVREGTGWVSSDDGLLVRDLDGNGSIDNGQELFGDNTLKADGTKATHGFEALSELDSNADGVFDANDTEFENLQVWQDANSDGISQSGELQSLSQAGISSINLSHESVDRATTGGMISDISTFTKTDGTTAEVGNLFLDKEPARSEFTDEVSISAEVLSTGIDIRGIGAVRNLSHAASLNPDLADILSDVSANPVAGLQTEDIVKEWTKSANFSDTLNLENLTLADGTSFTFDISDDTRAKLEKVQTLETFTGNKIIQTAVEGNQLTMTYGSVSMSYDITAGQDNILSDKVFANGWKTINRRRAIEIAHIADGYQSIKNSIGESLFKQIIYPELVSQLEFNYDDASGDVTVDFSGVDEFFDNAIEISPAGGIQTLLISEEVLGDSFIANGWDFQGFSEKIFDRILSLDLTQSQIDEINSKELLIGDKVLRLFDESDNKIYGKNNVDEYISAGEGDDSINLGDDFSVDIVRYNLGDGFDTISGGSFDSRSVVEFGEGILQSDLSFRRSKNDLIIEVKEDSSQGIRVEGFYLSSKVGSLKFSDGNVLLRNSSELNIGILGTEGSDSLSGSSGYDDVIIGGKGNDSINLGNDSSTDVVKYDLGDGFDIVRGETSGNPTSVIEFGEGILQSDLSFVKSGDDLIVQIGEYVSQGIRIEDFYSSHDESKIGSFRFSDGSVLLKDSPELMNIKILGTDGDDTLISSSGVDDVIIGGKGDDIIGLGSRAWESSADIVRYNLGDGFDTIWGTTSSDSTSVVEFGEGISQSDLSFVKSGDDLIIQIGENASQGIKIEDFYSSSKIGSFKFSDGGVLLKDSPELMNIEILGTDGDDTLISSSGVDDVIIGGKGDDSINLGSDSSVDIVRYNLGDGFDTIWGTTSNDPTSVVEFGEGISQSDLSFVKSGDDLIIQIGGDTSQGIKIRSFYSSRYKSKIGSFKFSDDSILLKDSPELMNIEILGTDGNDTLISSSGVDDVIIGGKGDDRINLGSDSSADTIRYNLGDGFDTIWGTTSNNPTSVLEFGEGISQEDLSFKRIKNNLVVNVGNDSSQGLEISDFFSDGYKESQLSTFEFADGSILTRDSEVFDLAIGGTDGNDSIRTTLYDDVIEAGKGDDTILGNEAYSYNPRGARDKSVDTIVYNLGDGFDTIVTSDIQKVKVAFGEEIQKENISFTKDSNDLIIQINNDSSQGMRVKNYYVLNNVESVELADGTNLGDDLLFEVNGTIGDDIISSTSVNDVITAGAGDDTIDINHTSEVNMYDTFFEVDDLSSDVIKYNLGDGFDTIVDTISWDEKSDVIEFGEGINQDNLSFRREINDLIINVDNDDSQGIRIEKFYTYKNTVKELKLADGSVIDRDSESLQLVSEGTDEAEHIVSDVDGDIIMAGKGDDTIRLNNYYGDTKANTIIYNLGDGLDTINSSATENPIDKIIFGEGIFSQDLSYQRVGDNDLFIQVGGDSSQGLVLSNYYGGKGKTSRIKTLEFADGEVLETTYLGYDTIAGTDQDDNLSVNYYQNNIVDAGEGNDSINLSSPYNKSLVKYNLGDGFDTIDYMDSNDIVEFGEGISQSDLSFYTKANESFATDMPSLLILVNDDINQGLEIRRYSFNEAGILKFADGSTMAIEGLSDLSELVLGTDEGESIYTSTESQETVIAGKGDDFIGLDNLSTDTVKYNLGDGFDRIFSYAYNSEQVTDIIEFGEGISVSNVSFSRDMQQNKLTVQIKDDSSQGFEIYNFYKNQNGSTVNQFKFADGTILDRSSEELNLALLGTDNSDTIWVSTSNDTIILGKGNDSIMFDYFSSPVGNTIKYNLGDGFDNISDSAYSLGATDTIEFGEGILLSDIILKTENGTSLVIQVGKDDSQGMMFSSFFENSRVKEFKFTDGTIITKDEIIAKGLDAINAELQGLTQPEPTLVGTESSEKIVGTNDTIDIVEAGAGNDTIYTGSGDDIVYAGEGNDTIKALNGGNNTMYSEAGNDIIEVGAGNDTLDGGSGDDLIKAGAGDDVITGGLGDDDIRGELGNNTINYNLGDGSDIVRAARTSVTSQSDKIVFGADITQDNVKYLQQNEDLFVQVGEDTTQGILIKKFYAKDGYQTKVSVFEFADGSFKSINDVQPITLGTESSEIINGTNDAIDMVYANDGSDTIYTGSGDDIVYAGEGDDTIKALNGGNNTMYGEAGNDTIEVGAGNDTLDGGSGDDLIKAGAGDDIITGGLGDDDIIGDLGSNIINYNLGDGSDIVRAARTSVTSQSDKIVFGADITQDNVKYLQQNEDLFVQVGEDATQGILIKKFYAKDGYQTKVSGFEFADGTTINLSDIKFGTNSDDILVGNSNDNVISGNAGNDIITGGTGDDILRGEDGADTYIYAKGDGTDIINASSEDGEIDSILFTDADHDELLLGRSGDDLEIYVGEENLLASVVDDYFTQKFNADRLEIDTSDDFQMQLWKNVQLIEEALEGMAADAQAENDTQTPDTDGGSVDGTSQTSTKLDASDLADLWIPKNKDGF